MSFPYTVKKGDSLSAIAKRFGVKSWQELYNLSENAAFRAKRPDPNLIQPGDVVTVPGSVATTGYVVTGMTRIQQTMNMSCWYASAQMLIRWRRDKTQSTEAGIVDPSEDPMSEAMKKSDTGISDAQIVAFAKRLGLEEIPPMSPTEAAIEQWLKSYGPLWVNGATHIVVIAGVRPGQVLVYDPAPGSPGGGVGWRSLSGWYTGGAVDSRDVTASGAVFLYCP